MEDSCYNIDNYSNFYYWQDLNFWPATWWGDNLITSLSHYAPLNKQYIAIYKYKSKFKNYIKLQRERYIVASKTQPEILYFYISPNINFNYIYINNK